MSPDTSLKMALEMPLAGAARSRNRRLALALGVGLVALVSATGCRQNMHNQAKVKPYRESDFFADGQSARPLPAHTVARGQLREDAAYYTGLGADGQPLQAPPMAITRDVLLRGQERFNAFCSPCHSKVGDGRGMIVQRGFKQPTSFHDPRLKAAAIGYFYNTMTEGFGQMPSYAAQIPPADRWAIAAYVRVLQYSQDARVADLTAEEKARLDEAWKSLEAAAAKPAEHGGHKP